MDSSFNLNLDEYNLEDIMDLFGLNHGFTESDLRNAKKVIMKVHPDKSQLDKKFFIFFSKAYNILCYIFRFREKHGNDGCVQYDKNSYNDEAEEAKFAKFIKSKDFNKKFNELFEANKLTNEFEEGGYGEWYKNQEEGETHQSITSMSQMGDAFHKERLRTKALVEYKGVQDMSNNGLGTDLAMSRPENYSSDLFSKLPYEDLRKAHEETVVPVLESDVKRSYNSFEQLKFQRDANRQSFVPLDGQDLKQHLKQKKYGDNIATSERAFALAKQAEQATEAKKNFNKNFQFLTGN
jgi:hypothetical protein